MNRLDRNPWQGLTTAQIHDLENALREPQHALVDRATSYEQIAVSYAVRSSTLLVANDLRGAMHNAEISVVVAAIAQRQRDAEREALELVAQQAARDADSPTRLVYVPGKQRRRRVPNPLPTTSEPSPRALAAQPDDVADLPPGDPNSPSLPDRLSHHVQQSSSSIDATTQPV